MAITNLLLDRLIVWHGSKDSKFPEWLRNPQNLLIETCLRKVAIALKSDTPNQSDIEPLQPLMQGLDAYDFLLRFTCGLESKVLGETEVFGQVRKVWHDFRPASSSDLNAVMEALLEDVKWLRSNHLEGLGGRSYGSLARKLLDLRQGDTVLLVGAGSVADSVLPYLTREGMNPFLTNRTRANAEALLLKHHAREKVEWIDWNRSEVWRQFHHVILCIPTEVSLDPEKRNALLNSNCLRTTLHLGGLLRDHRDWKRIPNFVSLNEIFELEQAQNQLREVALARAREACTERARHRNLGGSLSQPHGWEDLLAFV